MFALIYYNGHQQDYQQPIIIAVRNNEAEVDKLYDEEMAYQIKMGFAEEWMFESSYYSVLWVQKLDGFKVNELP